MHTPPIRAAAPLLSSSALDGRGTAILRELVELYVHTGEPVGSGKANTIGGSGNDGYVARGNGGVVHG
jgi:hypothetical protein